jgi:hypothetical protein
VPAQFAFTYEEKQAFKQRRRGSAPGTELDESGAAWRSLFKAARCHARCHARGDTRAKRQWYAHMCALDSGGPGGGGGGVGGGVGGAASVGCVECGCGCDCVQCRAGYCLRCGRCACKQPRLLGHCFGLMEQFFLLLPATRAASPMHFSTSTAWTCAAPYTYMRPRLPSAPVSPRYHPSRCAAPTCDYAYAASAPTLQLPLLLSATDLDSLLHAGVSREVGCTYFGYTYHGSTYHG